MNTFPNAPVAPEEKNDAATQAFEALMESLKKDGQVADDAFAAFVAAADVRHAWLLSDLLRFIGSAKFSNIILEAFEQLTQISLADNPEAAVSPWNAMTNTLIAWDTPAPPDYVRLKGLLYTSVDPRWEPLFADEATTADFRHVSWGGVFIDDRPLGDPNPCQGRGCIPALDDPKLVSAEEGSYYPDDSAVFGIIEGDDVVALPKNMMQIHEMVNMTVGGRRMGIPYCTLCGSAQAFYTDAQALPDGVETPILRTSGLLKRSNKFMYDLVTKSTLDTFTGAATSGPLREKGVFLQQKTVSVSTWKQWKEAYPHTKIIAEDGGIGREYPLDPLHGRDDDGPIFPIGRVDERLPVQEPVLGLIAEMTVVALQVSAVEKALGDKQEAEIAGFIIKRQGGGFMITDTDGEEIPSHEAFWFAWSQFHPETELWTGEGKE